MNPVRPHWWPAYVGLGSNVDEPVAQLERAFAELAALPETFLRARSGLYRSAPVGPAGQPDFINACALLPTRLPPQLLLERLQAIETAHGRRHDGASWGPRPLDLDLLLYGFRTFRTPELTLPHPRITERNFVLLPLSEIAPGLTIPGQGSVSALSERVGRTDPRIERLNPQ